MSEGSSRDYRQALTDIDITKPNVARVYDYFVGGKDNFAADREFARRAMASRPRRRCPPRTIARSCAGWCATWSARRASPS